jgi:Zn-dependent protease with chaperone function
MGMMAIVVSYSCYCYRWRTILLSPEEEEEIAAQLANGGWYNAVAEIVSQDGPATLIPPTDWRYRWVEDVLRRLESTIPYIHQEQHREDWIDAHPSTIPFPPPAEYPLRARPRASEYLHSICEAMVNKHMPPSSHGIPGAPYSLMLVDDPNAANAFSYGFGPDGAGGIVVFSGFLDEILSRAPSSPPTPDLSIPLPTPPQSTSWFSSIFGAPSPPTQSPTFRTPTSEQTSELATLMAHELAHLMLAHHLETLSSGTIVVPGFISLVTDFVRVLVFPITMLFGPFVNDALANVGKNSTLDLARIGEHCTSVYQEVEADVVSMRLLAYAGFDARDAVRFWQKRIEVNPNAECTTKRSDCPVSNSKMALTHKITGDDHPLAETRILRLREELQSWDEQRQMRLEERRESRTAER